MEIDIRALKTQISQAAAQRAAKGSKHASAQASVNLSFANGAPVQEAEFPPLTLQTEFQPSPNNRYHVNDLLKYHDQYFIRAAYRAILKRDPDTVGLQSNLENLRSGSFNKIDIILGLRSAEEGRTNAVRIDGLRLPALVRTVGRLPVVGYLIQWFVAFARLPVSIHNQRRFESYVISQEQQIADHTNQRLASLQISLNQRFESLSALMAAENNRLASECVQLAQGQEHLLAAQLATREEIYARLAEGQNQITQHSRSLTQLTEERVNQFSQRLQQTRAQLAAQEARLSLLLDEASKRLPSLDEAQLHVFTNERVHYLDALYSSFEDQFRGARTDIKERLRVYIPILKEAGIAADVVDLGCGRGEWLETLKEEGVQARGVEINRVAIEQCRSRGLEVVDEDVMCYLQKVPEQSLSAVTCFHLIEHLDFETLIKFLDRIIACLKPGGLIIMETPDPENVLVSSHNFYLDPSHRHPLPSELMQFLLESRGASRVKVMRVNPLTAHNIEGDSELIQRFNHYFYGPMDYGIVAWKV
ncbi:MAG: methyltransferase domain-containing protein [bacterium]